MDLARVDLLIQFALAAAAQADDGSRELGQIHLLKYVYLGDVAYAEAHDGITFTQTPWRFYKLGPWSGAVLDRIEGAAVAIGASERRFTSVKFEGEGVRWRLRHDSDEISEELSARVPWEIARALKAAVRKFGDDTSELLHHVYGTQPMLSAAPGEELLFVAAERPERAEPAPSPQLTDRQLKLQRQDREKLREKLRARMEARPRKLIAPDPPPRYDEIFEAGTRLMDEDAGSSIEAERGELHFSPEVWKSRGRRDAGDS